MKKPNEIWAEYQSGIDYLTQIDIYETVELNQKFVNGDQWSGVIAPDIEKPVVNVLAPTVEWYNAMLVSDDIAINCDLKEDDELNKQAMESIVISSIEDVFEFTKFKPKLRIFCRNASIDGGSYIHWWYNTKRNMSSKHKGCIDVEILDNTNVIFGNPAEVDEQKQPYIITVAKLPTESVKEMAKKHADEIHENWDDQTNLEMNARANTKYTTVLTRFWKKGDIVYCCKSTQNVMLTNETSLGLTQYPIAKMNWKTLKNAYQGVSKISEVIPNQIMINKGFMMVNEFLKKTAFPKMIYNKDIIEKWSNKVEALGVSGDPREAVFSVSPAITLNEQFFRHIDNLIAQTKQTLGLQDVSIGNIKADNTSAIIALQKTAAQPLELQRLELFTAIENSVRIITEIMSVSYGIRETGIKTKDGQGNIMFDFKDLQWETFNMNVEVGQSYYWSNVGQVQTIDNMYKIGVIPDSITYLEQLPNGTVKNRQEIIDAIKRIKEEQMMANQPPVMPQQAIPQ